MTSDPIADMLTRVRNAIIARHPKVDVPASRLKTELARILKEEGYIINFKLTEEGARKFIRLYLKYTPGNQPVISHIERVSRRVRRHPARTGRVGNQHFNDAARRHDRHHRPQGRRRRRSALPDLVMSGNEPHKRSFR